MPDDGDDPPASDDDRVPPPGTASPIGPVEPRREPSKLELAYEEDAAIPRDAVLEAAVDEMNAIADRYEGDGWETVPCHPGGVSILTGDRDDERIGIEVVVPDNELDVVTEVLEDGSFDSYQVYRGALMGMILFVVAVEDGEGETALLFAGSVHPQEAEPLFERDDLDGTFGAYLSAVGGDYVELASLDVEYFRPERDPAVD